ncbi:piggyBac transposable element-derived protein 4-like [Acyrthosiphon pisum]|uniref:PiggyBac transposable element-derived protein domain-containing protein n=1 Tax=Acyrthosiphon pisum TaxID=7029 RepID=A0A8R2B710_ACYPI|nr:piggyBac transposable element-derived protein 4-like [Acyrthosiphon pisum]|eukprot:XP_008184865.1 PREDICTED: piggyBac transposable element-derived protein 4-like [Acyrthosiphon pisum]
MSKKLSNEEIARELDEYFANSESEDELYDFDLANDDSDPSFYQSRPVDNNFILINSNTNSQSNANGVYNSNQVQYNTPTEISQHDLQASGLLHDDQYLFKDVDIDEALENFETDFQDYFSQNESFQSPSSSITQQSRASSDSGVQCEEFDLNEASPVIDYFEAFITYDLIGKIVFETNRYAQEQPIISEHSRMVYWKDTSMEELYIFLGVTILMARNKNQQIKGDRLYKIKMVLTEVRKNFKDAMIPFSNLAIDESLILWKGRLSFKQYIKSKRHRFGIKLYVMCDCETDFILNFIVYTGATVYKDPLEDILGKSGVIVKDLMKPYLNKGYSLFTDNFYTSPQLSMYLHKRKTNTCGTVRKNRKLMPSIEGKLKLGEREARCTDKLLAIHWKDRRDVYMLTSMNTNEMVDTKNIDRKTGKKYLKPQYCVVSYNKNMGAIDKTDMLLSSTECVRRTLKWYKKLFFHIIDMSMLNAYSAYKTVTGKHISLADFQLTLINEILQKYKSSVKTTPSKGKKIISTDSRLSERHFPDLIPQTSSKKQRRKCFVCSHKTEGKKRTDTLYQCNECNFYIRDQILVLNVCVYKDQSEQRNYK